MTCLNVFDHFMVLVLKGLMLDGNTNFGGTLSGPVALLGFIFRVILLISLTDRLPKWNRPFCERFFSINFTLRCFFM